MPRAVRGGPAERQPLLSCGLGVEEAAGFTTGLAITADVSAFGSEDDDRDRFIGLVAELPVGGRIHADHASGFDRRCLAITEDERDFALVDEIDLFLPVMEVRAGLVPRRQDDRVDAHLLDVYGVPDLAKSRTLTDPVE